MGKTDNTQPYELQGDDQFRLGYVSHGCSGSRLDCDYEAGNGLYNFRLSYPAGGRRCQRDVYVRGGINRSRNVDTALSNREERSERRRVTHHLRMRRHIQIEHDLRLKVQDWDMISLSDFPDRRSQYRGEKRQIRQIMRRRGFEAALTEYRHQEAAGGALATHFHGFDRQAFTRRQIEMVISWMQAYPRSIR